MNPLDNVILELMNRLTDDWSPVGDVSALHIDAIKMLTGCGCVQLRGTITARMTGFSEAVESTVVICGNITQDDLNNLARTGFPGTWFDVDGRTKGRALLEQKVMEDMRLTSRGVLMKHHYVPELEDFDHKLVEELPTVPIPMSFVQSTRIVGSESGREPKSTPTGGRPAVTIETKLDLLDKFETGRNEGRWKTQSDFADIESIPKSTVSEHLRDAKNHRKNSENVRKTNPN